jgi:hypothetical protein
MPSFRGESHSAVNRTVATIPARSIVAIIGYDAQNDKPTLGLAVASGISRRADGITSLAMLSNRGGFFRREDMLIGTAASPINTAAAAVGAPVYLSPTVPGAWTFTRPTGAGQDVQEIGAVLVSDVTIGVIRFCMQAGGVLGLGPDSIGPASLEQKPLADIGAATKTHLRIAGAVTDGDRVSLNGRIYEFDTTAPPGAIGAGADVRVGVSGGEGGTGAANAAAQLTAALNADAARSFDAVVLAGTGIMALNGRVTTTGADYATTAPVDAGGVLIWKSAASVGAADPAAQDYVQGQHILDAADVATLAVTLGTSEIVIGTFPKSGITTPRIRAASAFRPAGAYADPILLAGAHFAWRQSNNNLWLLCYTEPAAGALLQALDVLSFTVSLPH